MLDDGEPFQVRPGDTIFGPTAMFHSTRTPADRRCGCTVYIPGGPKKVLEGLPDFQEVPAGSAHLDAELMQAVRIHEYGPPSNLVFEQVPDPEPAAGEVVVELRAAAVNRRDTAVRRGAYGDFPLPLTPGSDGARDPARHRRGGRDPPGSALGRSRRHLRPGVRHPRRARGRHLCGAGQDPGRERVPEAPAVVVGGGGNTRRRQA